MMYLWFILEFLVLRKEGRSTTQAEELMSLARVRAVGKADHHDLKIAESLKVVLEPLIGGIANNMLKVLTSKLCI
jgi:hypothetical protein